MPATCLWTALLAYSYEALVTEGTYGQGGPTFMHRALGDLFVPHEPSGRRLHTDDEPPIQNHPHDGFA